MGKYIIILEANPQGYAVDTTLTARNRLADDLIDAGQAKEIDEPMRPGKAEDTQPDIHVTVSPQPTKSKSKAARPPKTVPKPNQKPRKNKF